MFPKLISIGSFYIPTYGVLVALGFLAGLAVTLRLARRIGLSADKVTNLAVYCAIAGIFGTLRLMPVLACDVVHKNLLGGYQGSIFDASGRSYKRKVSPAANCFALDGEAAAAATLIGGGDAVGASCRGSLTWKVKSH